MSETTPFHVGQQGDMAILCQMVEWFNLYMSLATSQESFPKMKGHLLKGPSHFPKYKGSPLWWSYWGLSWTSYSFLMVHWSGQSCSRCSMGQLENPFSLWAPLQTASFLVISQKKVSAYDIPKVAILRLNPEAPNSLYLVNSLLKLYEWMFHDLI